MKLTQTKILFRAKRGTGTWKVFTVQRIPGVKRPKQIHLGYVPSTVPIQPHHREKLREKLREKCHTLLDYYNGWDYENTDIDWDDAEAKLKSKIKTPLKPEEQSKTLAQKIYQTKAYQDLKQCMARKEKNAVGDWLAQYTGTEPMLTLLLAVNQQKSATRKSIESFSGYSPSKVYRYLVDALDNRLITENKNCWPKVYHLCNDGLWLFEGF